MAATTPKVPSDNPLLRVFRLLFDIRVIGVLAQIAAVVLVILFFSWIASNTVANLEKLGSAQFICRDGTSSLRCAFDFLQSDAQFAVQEGVLDYEPDDSYWLALAQGALNTLRITIYGIILTTILGTFVGIARLSTNWLVSNIAKWYVDILRNTPLVLQLIFIFFTFFSFFLPNINEATRFLGLPVYLTRRGIVYPSLTFLSGGGVWLAFIILGLIQAQVTWVLLGRREEKTGIETNRSVWTIVGFLLIAILGYGFASTLTSTHGIMAPNSLRVRDVDDLDPLVRNRFGVNFVDEISERRTNMEAVREQIINEELTFAGELLTLDDIDGNEENGEIAISTLSRLVGMPLISLVDYDAAALKLCAVRDSKAALNFTSQLDGVGIPYVIDYESRANSATANYVSGECEIYVGELSLLAAERATLENGSAQTVSAIDEPPVIMSLPRLRGFNFQGGASISTAFAALLIGLVINTGANVAEIVRAGIQSVSKGQTEAARALGLNEGQRLRLVILPQALQVIIPPLISQYLNLAKNSTLALAIGFPDIFNVAMTTINQSGRSIQIMVILMVMFLTLSLTISTIMNIYNQRVAIKER